MQEQTPVEQSAGSVEHQQQPNAEVPVAGSTVVTNQAKLTPEQEEEIKLRSKYPNPQKPGGSAFLHKMITKQGKKYFDSGDYNMAKSKTKQALLNNIQTTTTIQQQQQQLNNSNDQSLSSPSSNTTSSDFNSPNAFQVDLSPSLTNISSLNGVNESILTSNLITLNASANSFNQSPAPIVSSSNSNNLSANHLNIHTTPLATSPMLSNSVSSSHLSNSNYLNVQGSNKNINNNNLNNNNNNNNNHPSLTSSLSSTSITMLSASISNEKLSNIQINPPNNLLIDNEEIGVGIPTPECLPQSRKHSIVQSKLATPRLSSS